MTNVFINQSVIPVKGKPRRTVPRMRKGRDIHRTEGEIMKSVSERQREREVGVPAKSGQDQRKEKRG